MADAISIQELIDARTDAKTLEEAVNGDAVTTVLSRLGETYPTLSNALNQIDGKLNSADAQIKQGITNLFESGGLPATPFATKALMTASALTDGKYAMVTDDTINNGLYVKTAGAWVKSSYDPALQANGYTDNLLKPINDTLNNKIDLSTIPTVKSYNGNTGVWVVDTVATGRFVKINPNYKYKITAPSNLDSHVYLTNSSRGYDIAPSPNNLDLRTTIPKGSSVIVDAKGYEYMWLSASDGANDRTPKSMEVIQNQVITSDKIITNRYSNNQDVPASAKVVRDLAADVDSLKRKTSYKVNGGGFTPLDFWLFEGRFVQPKTSTTVGLAENPRVVGLEIVLKAGDVLSFDYHPMAGTVLWQKVSATDGHPLLTHTHFSKSVVYSYSHTAPTDCAVWLSHSVDNSITINGAAISNDDIKYLGFWGRYAGLQMTPPNYEATDVTKGTSAPIKVNKGDTIRIVGGIKGSPAILMEIEPTNNYWLYALSIPDDYPSDTIEWVATETTRVVLNGYMNTQYSIKRENYLEYALSNIKGEKEAQDIVEMNLTKPETVFATHLNYILKMEMVDGVEHIATSEDLGKTWVLTPNIIGKITNYHFFTDGTILLSSEKKCYWTTDFVTWNESVLLNQNGTPFVASLNAHHFFGQQNGDKPMFVDGKELYIWGDYAVANTTISIWCTTDFGRTVKRVLKNGDTVDGVTLSMRHVHKVYYHPKNETFYVTSGDAGNDIVFLQGNYNAATDVWTWKLLGQGPFFKFGNMFFDDYYAYAITDYTLPEWKDRWGILRVGINYLDQPDKYTLAYRAPNDTGVGSPYRIIADRNGNKVILPDLSALGFIWVSTNGTDFHKVMMTPRSVLYFVIGANDNGDIYVKAPLYGRQLGENSGQFLTGGTVNLTKSLRQAGLTNFMRGERMMPFLRGASE